MRLIRAGRWRLWVALVGICAGIGSSLWPDETRRFEKTAAEAATERALDGKTPQLYFDHVSLHEAADIIARLAGVRIVRDHNEFARLHLNWDHMPVAARLRDVRLSKALRVIAQDADSALTVTVQPDGVVCITTVRGEFARGFEVSYDMSDLSIAPDEPAAQVLFQDIRQLVIDTVDPDSWSDHGGEATIRVRGHRLIVRQTRENLRFVDALLAQLFETRPSCSDVALLFGQEKR